MASFELRSSHFRHVYGAEAKRDQWFDNVPTSNISFDSPLCAVNPKFMAVCLEWSGGGSFLVLPHDKVGRVDKEQVPKFLGHASDVLDLAWNPFNDNMIASSSDDAKIIIWDVPEGGPTTNITKPLLEFAYHQRRVGIIQWHPTAENILLSASLDTTICIWNLETDDCVVEITCHPDIIFSVDWNYDGSLIATACKDKKLRIINPRTGEVVKEAEGHKGDKVQQVVFCGETNTLFTTGFSRMSERQYALWSKDLEQKEMQQIDKGHGVQFIRYDPDTNLVWLIGKGDSIIRYYELKLGTVAAPTYGCFWLGNFSSGEVDQRGLGFMPKRGCNISQNEVAKIYRVIKNSVVPVSFRVPTKSELFQSDLFPDTKSGEPSLTAEEWFNGKDAPPKRMPCEPLFHVKSSSTTAKKEFDLGALKRRRKQVGGREEEVDVPKLLATVATLTQKFAALEETVGKLNTRMVTLEGLVQEESK